MTDEVPVFHVVTLFPQLFESWEQEGIISRGLKQKLFTINKVNLRHSASDERMTVDDTPYGGGDGMIIRCDVTAKALESVISPQATVVHLSPKGRVFDSGLARQWSSAKNIVFLCGRYGGFDDRVTQKYCNAEVSLGDFVLTGGELACMCMIEATARFIPGVLGNSESPYHDSFSSKQALLEAPAYTKPRDWEGIKAPDVLFSGDHKNIEDFRRREQIKITALNRPDIILENWETLSVAERALVKKIWQRSPRRSQ